ncbi:Hypothetical predicted protein [Marmota monax]|uniref:Uncharacterized protein n=1 Tax=Marmota monax TaxID=9995 RepID=A0A5E4B938_MARMO|nr:hypothetical protein GHT09_006499 [Marmota monax]VTJ66183.1 Hypothetical predicted protein [Marmota monax]
MSDVDWKKDAGAETAMLAGVSEYTDSEVPTPKGNSDLRNTRGLGRGLQGGGMTEIHGDDIHERVQIAEQESTRKGQREDFKATRACEEDPVLLQFQILKLWQDEQPP